MEEVKTLYGSTTDISRCPGYCKRHGCYMTAKMIKNKECLRKQCRHFDKHEEHPWWTQRAAEKARKKEKRKAKYEFLDNKQTMGRNI